MMAIHLSISIFLYKWLSSSKNKPPQQFKILKNHEQIHEERASCRQCHILYLWSGVTFLTCNEANRQTWKSRRHKILFLFHNVCVTQCAVTFSTIFIQGGMARRNMMTQRCLVSSSFKMYCVMLCAPSLMWMWNMDCEETQYCRCVQHNRKATHYFNNLSLCMRVRETFFLICNVDVNF